MNQLPFISEQEFGNACRDIEHRLRNCGIDCKFVIQDDQQCLIIRSSARDQTPDMKRSHYTHPPAEEDDSEDDVHEDADPACFRVPPLHPWTVPVEYHVLLSRSYQVPVLYFQSLYPLHMAEQPSVEHVLEHLVPPSLRPQAESHHPLSGRTFFMIHPCNTADALRDILADSDPSPSRYLQIWLGLVGPTVGLHLPVEMALAEAPSDPTLSSSPQEKASVAA